MIRLSRLFYSGSMYNPIRILKPPIVNDPSHRWTPMDDAFVWEYEVSYDEWMREQRRQEEIDMYSEMFKRDRERKEMRQDDWERSYWVERDYYENLAYEETQDPGYQYPERYSWEQYATPYYY